eukprot:8645286-Ditylum_brightwellii.AAC.1
MGNHHTGKCKKKDCDYPGLCHHDTKECSFYQAGRKHIQPTHHITEQQMLQQVRFVKDAKRHAIKCGLSAKKVKDLNTFVKDKIDEIIKQHDCGMHVMNNFKDLSISSYDKNIQSIISKTSVEGSDGKSCKPASKK